MELNDYDVIEGSYEGTNDDRRGRWYAVLKGQILDKRGAGFSSEAAAWAWIRATVKQAAEMEAMGREAMKGEE